MTESLLEHIKDCKSIPEALEKASAWMTDTINAALHAHGEGRSSPIIKATDTSEGGQIVGDSLRADLPAYLEPSRFFASCLHAAAKTLHACQPKEERPNQDGPRPAAVMYLFPACPQQIQEAFEQYSQDPHRKKSTLRGLQAAALVAESTNKVIEKYLDVMVALDLIGDGDKIKHIHVDLLNGGQTKQDGKTHDDVINRIKSLKVIKNDEDEASVRLVNNLNSIITKYLDVGEALGLVGHDRGLIAAELFSDGETRQIGKSHECILRKAKSVCNADLTLEQYRPVHERMNEMKAENAEQREHLATWQSEMIYLAKNLKVIDDESTYFPSDPQYAKDLGDKVGAKCYEMRAKIKQCETEQDALKEGIDAWRDQMMAIASNMRMVIEYTPPLNAATMTRIAGEIASRCNELGKELELERDRSTRMQKTIDEQRSALNNANQQIEYLRTEITKGHEANTKLALELQDRAHIDADGVNQLAAKYEIALRTIGALIVERNLSDDNGAK